MERNGHHRGAERPRRREGDQDGEGGGHDGGGGRHDRVGSAMTVGEAATSWGVNGDGGGAEGGDGGAKGGDGGGDGDDGGGDGDDEGGDGDDGADGGWHVDGGCNFECGGGLFVCTPLPFTQYGVFRSPRLWFAHWESKRSRESQ